MGFFGWIVPSEWDYAGFMKNLIIGSLSVVSAFASAAAQAGVIAAPAFQDVGSVAPGRTATTLIQFINTSGATVRFFNVFCSGDPDFSCSSACFQISPYGSCNVFVYFSPRNGDGLRKTLFLNGSGDGNFATATVYGTDAKKP